MVFDNRFIVIMSRELERRVSRSLLSPAISKIPVYNLINTPNLYIITNTDNQCRTDKVHSKYQVPNMFAVVTNVIFGSFQYLNLKVLRYHMLCVPLRPAAGHITCGKFCAYFIYRQIRILRLGITLGGTQFFLIPLDFENRHWKIG